MKQLIKNLFKNLAGIFTILALSLVFLLAGCSSPAGDDTVTYTVSSAEFQSTIESIKAVPGKYIIKLTGNLIDFPGINLSTSGVTITVKGTGSNKITWKHADVDPCTLFAVEGGKLVLEDIIIGRGKGNTESWALLDIDGGTIEIKKGVNLSNNDNETTFFEGVWIDSGAFIMSGGVIEKCSNGVITDRDDVSITITGGKISNNEENGVYSKGNGSIISVSDAEIIYNTEDGIKLIAGKEKCKLTISGGKISNNGNRGVTNDGNKNDITITGGKIIGNVSDGVFSEGTGNTIFISNVEISGNEHGISLYQSEDSELTISGETIVSGSNGWGMYVDGANIQFKKEQGSIIYGDDADDNSNKDGAIEISCIYNPAENLNKFGSAGINDILSAKINAAGDGIEDSTGDWDI